MTGFDCGDSGLVSPPHPHNTDKTIHRRVIRSSLHPWHRPNVSPRHVQVVESVVAGPSDSWNPTHPPKPTQTSQHKPQRYLESCLNFVGDATESRGSNCPPEGRRWKAQVRPAVQVLPQFTSDCVLKKESKTTLVPRVFSNGVHALVLFLLELACTRLY